MYSLGTKHKRTRMRDLIRNFLFAPLCKRKEDASDTLSNRSHEIKLKTFSAGVLPEHVVLYSSGAIFSFVGVSLLGLSIWSLAWKLLAYSYFMDIITDPTFFNIPAALIGLPSIFLTIAIRRNQFSHLLIFLVLQMIAIVLLFTGYSIGTKYKLLGNDDILRLGPTVPTNLLNNTLYDVIQTYEETLENNVTLDGIQSKFGCCGVINIYDFGNLSLGIPTSCCPNSDCNQGIYPWGCRRRIQENVAWHTNVTLSITQLLILMVFFNAAMIGSVFISDYYK
ncbi:tetraspanin-7 isoform X2 [Dendroctonus ponderosae]|uniref:Tetraspanin n=1 Tax=Dendroctonus ponderosae TaxID=77166 RepID=A0AAR5PSS8_DENPD|nr:tetraspanin-7 isoform X2 [Dendroctonus ponderosae]KAH1020996.1 hypothetical protein HUJ04_010574 [Dendroctonus ponderosae]